MKRGIIQTDVICLCYNVYNIIKNYLVIRPYIRMEMRAVAFRSFMWIFCVKGG